MINEKDLTKAFEDKEFVEKIFRLEDIADVQKAFKEDKNIDISFDELEELQQAILKIVDKVQKGEISEEELENISGGGAASKVAGGVLKVVGAATITVAAIIGAIYCVDKYTNISDGYPSRPSDEIEDIVDSGKRWFHDVKKGGKRLWRDVKSNF